MGNGTNGQIQLFSWSDYNPLGSVMSGRNSIGTTIYRYGYQGQFSEMDNETGLNNFEDRMYDAIKGRWDIPDRMHQHHSPYMAMGNNWVSRVDPDGADDFYYSSTQLDRFGLPKLLGYVAKAGPNRYFMEFNNGGNFTYKGKSYVQVNSQKTILGGDGKPGRFAWNGLIDYSGSDISQMADAGIGRMRGGLLSDYVKGSLPRAALDFKTQLPQDLLIGFDGIYYNLHEAGNFLWGAASERMGILTPLQLRINANGGTLLTGFRFDESNEIRAATRGFTWSEDYNPTMGVKLNAP